MCNNVLLHTYICIFTAVDMGFEHNLGNCTKFYYIFDHYAIWIIWKFVIIHNMFSNTEQSVLSFITFYVNSDIETLDLRLSVYKSFHDN